MSVWQWFVNRVSVVVEQYSMCCCVSSKQNCVVCAAEYDVTVIDSGVAVVGEFAESADALQNTVVIKTNHCCYKTKSSTEQF